MSCKCPCQSFLKKDLLLRVCLLSRVLFFPNSIPVLLSRFWNSTKMAEGGSSDDEFPAIGLAKVAGQERERSGNLLSLY